MGTQTEPLLQATGVRKIYRTGAMSVVALANLDFEVHPGELVAVMGPSGSGKTTLLNCLSGLDDIDDGQVVVQGRDLFAMSDGDRTDHRAHAMGFVFQAFNLIPVFTAAEKRRASAPARRHPTTYGTGTCHGDARAGRLGPPR